MNHAGGAYGAGHLLDGGSYQHHSSMHLGSQNTTEGYGQLKNAVDDLIAYLVAKKEKINDAQTNGDASLLQDQSSMLSSYLANQTNFWTAEVSPTARVFPFTSARTS